MPSFIKTIAIMSASLFGLPLTYLGALEYSRHKIDMFCSSVGPTASMQDLAPLATKAGVELSGPIELSQDGRAFLYAVSADAFSMGDYACRIQGEVSTGKVTSKRLGV